MEKAELCTRKAEAMPDFIKSKYRIKKKEEELEKERQLLFEADEHYKELNKDVSEMETAEDEEKRIYKTELNTKRNELDRVSKEKADKYAERQNIISYI